MNYIHLQTKERLISMMSNRLSENIFIDLTDKSDQKIKAIDKIIKKYNFLDSKALSKLREQHILTW